MQLQASLNNWLTASKLENNMWNSAQLQPAPAERKLELQVPLTTQLSVEREKLLNNRISRGKRVPLIFRECGEVDAKGIFKISLLVWILLNTETTENKKRKKNFHVSIVYFYRYLIRYISIWQRFTHLDIEVKHLSDHT